MAPDFDNGAIEAVDMLSVIIALLEQQQSAIKVLLTVTATHPGVDPGDSPAAEAPPLLPGNVVFPVNPVPIADSMSARIANITAAMVNQKVRHSRPRRLSRHSARYEFGDASSNSFSRSRSRALQMR